MNSIVSFAATEVESENSGLFESLGVDVRLLIVQTIAFMILLALLTKFVYPVLNRMLEAREESIQKSAKAASEADRKAAEAKAEMTDLLDDARRQAGTVMASAKTEAASVLEAADAAATARAERIVTEAHAKIEKDVEAARSALRDETISLVALATEKVVGNVMTTEIDKKVITSAIKDAR